MYITHPAERGRSSDEEEEEEGERVRRRQLDPRRGFGGVPGVPIPHPLRALRTREGRRERGKGERRRSQGTGE